MESENPFFNFVFEYDSRPVRCQVIMKEVAYDLLFDGQWVASIAHSDEWAWTQTSGETLPDTVINEIGSRIESEYE